MIQSMTGFGRGVATGSGVEVTVEVRSVNGRYVDVGLRAPRELGPHEVEIQNRVRARLERGKVTVSIQVEREGSTPGLGVDERAARAVGELLERLRSIAGTDDPVRLEHFLHFKERFAGGEVTDHLAEPWEPTAAALDQALEQCLRLRAEEGRALAGDLRERLGAIGQELVAIEEMAPARVARARDDMRARISELLAGAAPTDTDRIELEIALLADKLDITEECVRLRSHLDLFREALEEGGAVGRRLNFLSQEMNREINTISSKANDAAMAHRAVGMKEELERIREQVQNVV